MLIFLCFFLVQEPPKEPPKPQPVAAPSGNAKKPGAKPPTPPTADSSASSGGAAAEAKKNKTKLREKGPDEGFSIKVDAINMVKFFESCWPQSLLRRHFHLNRLQRNAEN